MVGTQRSTVIWTVVCILLTGAIIVDLSKDMLLPSDVQAAPIAGRDLSSSVYEAPSINPILPASIKTAIAERPLFEPTRRPVVTALDDAEGSTASSSEPPVAELAGTLLKNEMGVALIIGYDTRSHRVRIGDVLEDWTVQMVARDRIHMEQEGRVEHIMLRPEKAVLRDRQQSQK